MSCAESRLVNTEGEYRSNGTAAGAYTGVGSNKHDLIICSFKVFGQILGFIAYLV